MHDHAFLAKLGGDIKRRRAALGLKQVELAELAGCSTRFVHTAEAGKATVRLDKLLALLRVLGLRLCVELSGGESGGGASAALRRDGDDTRGAS